MICKDLFIRANPIIAMKQLTIPSRVNIKSEKLICLCMKSKKLIPKGEFKIKPNCLKLSALNSTDFLTFT